MSRAWLTAAAAFLLLLELIGGAAFAARNDAVYRAVEANHAAALELLQQIVNIDSGTGDVEGGAKVDAVLADRLKQLGAEVRTEAAESAGLPGILVAVFHGTGKGKSSSSRTSIRYLVRAPSRADHSAWTMSARTARVWATKRPAW
ncbi:MAG: hypothetical protein ACLPWG_11960 [Steroidobacteraceae bacterium]